MASDCGNSGPDSGPLRGEEYSLYWGEKSDWLKNGNGHGVRKDAIIGWDGWDKNDDGEGGKGKRNSVAENEVEVEEELNWNDTVCFLESAKAELRERKKDHEEIYGETGGPCGWMGTCDMSELEHDDGDNDGLEIEDYYFSEDELSIDEGEEDCEEDEDDDVFDDIDPNEASGPLEERRVQEEPDGSEQRPFFMVGGTYADKGELVRAINYYAIKSGVKVKLTKSEPFRVRATCQKGCPFVVYASREGTNPGLVVKTLDLRHECNRVFKNPRASVKWLAGYFKKKVQERPQYKISDMKKDVEDELKLHVSIWKCKRAKKMITKEMEGSYVDEFNNLEAYCNELRDSNPGSDVGLMLSKDALENGRRVFSRLYVCFNAAKVDD